MKGLMMHNIKSNVVF